MLGQTISHYRILRQLGEGGMGVVFLAEDTRLGRRVALKFPGASVSVGAPVEQSFHTRFLREARALSTLSHKNIATVYDYGETPEGQPFIVMEYVDGTPLNDLLQHRKMTIKRHIEIALAVAEALSAAHDKGIVHRDIKPSNIVLTRAGDVKVLDFGLAKQIASYVNDAADPEAKTLPTDGTELRTLSGAIVGTPLYLSPEQAKGATVDGRSDIFALGALLYEMVAGRPAFSGANAIAIGAQIIHVDPPPPSSYNAHVPAELDQIVAHALQKDAAARYQTAAEMNADLRLLLAHLQETDDGDVPVRRSVIAVARGKKTNSASGSHNGNAMSSPDAAAATNGRAGTFAPAHLSSSALRSFSGAVETLRRPRLSLATVLVAALVTLALGWVVVRWWSQPVVREPKKEARSWYDKGAAAMRDGAYFQASKLFVRAIAEDDSYALAHARLAEAYTEIDDIDRAKDEMLAVGQLAPDANRFPALERHYLEAVRATVRRDFQRAVAEYQEIVKLKPAEAAAHVDLGRAYEKANDAKRAVESYTGATRLEPSYSTGFLRLGIVHTRQNNMTAADAAFDRAEAIYQTESNTEGRAEVLFQRGVLYDKNGRYAKARQMLEASLQLSRATGNRYQQIAALLRLSGVNYAFGDSAQAEPLAREAIALAESSDLQSLTARGLIDLGNVFLTSGDNADAAQHFTRALEIARRARSARNEALALLSLGSVHVQIGALDAGVREIEQALAFYQQGDYRKQIAQANTLLSRAYRQRGDLDASLRIAEQLLAQAEAEHDNEQIFYAHSSLGMTLLLAERYTEAERHFAQQHDAAHTSGDEMNVAYGLQGRAEALWHLGRYADADVALDQATQTAERTEVASKGLLTDIYLTRAASLASRLRFDEAAKIAQDSLKFAETSASKLSALEAKSLLALISLRAGDRVRGVRLCDEAVREANALNIPSSLSSLRLIEAEKSLLQRDFARAHALAVQAQAEFTARRQLDSQWRAWLLAGRASLQANDAEAARRELAQAVDALDRLAESWGAEQFNTYAARPDIALARRQLEEWRKL